MITMDNIHGGSWKKLQNWATGLFLKKTADSALNMNGNNITNAGNLYTQAQVNSTFMKKTADSDLDMQGYNIKHISQLISNPSYWNRISSITPYPTYTYEELGFTSQPDIKDLTLAYIKKIATDTTMDLRNGLFVTTIPEPYCLLICDFRWTSSDVNEEGVPHSCSGFVIPMQTKGVAYKFQIYQYVYDFYQDSMFPYGDTTKDNRINAMGSDYIRYENGLQICWGQKSILTGATYTSGALNRAKWNPTDNDTFNFPQPFNNTPSTVATVATGYSYTITNFIRNASRVTEILFEGGIAHSDGINVGVTWMAIGTWK